MNDIDTVTLPSGRRPHARWENRPSLRRRAVGLIGVATLTTFAAALFLSATHRLGDAFVLVKPGFAADEKPMSGGLSGSGPTGYFPDQFPTPVGVDVGQAETF